MTINSEGPVHVAIVTLACTYSNFIVKPVCLIQATPRKRFKCPECANGDALATNQVHFVARSECIQEFVKLFGHMPLKTVEFRADPILHQGNIPERIKRFKNLGTI